MEIYQDISQTKNECSIHSFGRICFASLKPDNQNPFYCSVCALENTETNTLISIEQIQSLDEYTPILNWPPGISQEQYEFLKYKNTPDLKESMQRGIMLFYDTLKVQINKMLSESEKSQLLELEQTKIGSEEVISLYNSLFKRKELVDIFKNKMIFSKEDFTNLLNTLNEQSNDNIEVFQKKIKEMKNNEVKFRKFQEQKMEDLINDTISIINQFSSLFLSNKEGNSDQDKILRSEKYEFTTYLTKGDEIKLKNEKTLKIYELQTKLNQFNQFEYKSTFMFKEQSKFDLDYEINGIIKISNPKKVKGSLTNYYRQNIEGVSSFKLKFNSFTSFEHFQVKFETINERKEFWMTEQLKALSQYIQHSRKMSLEFKIQFQLKSNFVEISSDNFYLKKEYIIDQSKETQYTLIFELGTGCERFQLSELSGII